jgi:hypothetical protein
MKKKNPKSGKSKSISKKSTSKSQKNDQKSEKLDPFSKLTPRQELFIEHYIANGGNGSRAALSAGYKTREEGNRLLSNALIWGEVKKRRQLLIDKLSLKSEDLLKEAAIIAFFGEINGWTVHAKLAAIDLIMKHTGQGSYKDGTGSGAGTDARKAALARLRKRFGLSDK